MLLDSAPDKAGTPLWDALRFLALTFAISWLILVPGTRQKWPEDYLIFGVAGPAIAAIFLSRKSLAPAANTLRRVAVSMAVALVGWIILLMSNQWPMGTVRPLRWDVWLIPPALLPALVCWGSLGDRTAKGQWLGSLILPPDWKWPLIALFSWPVFLLIPAALFHLAGGRLFIPGGARLSGAYVATSAVLFGKQLLFAGVLEEPGWRGYLLPRFQDRFSPLLASLFVWLPWAVWHAPLDFAGSVGSSWVNYIEIRVVFFPVIAILLTWLYNRSGRYLLAVALFHAGFNTFPFVLPYSPPMLALLLPCVMVVIISDRMWKRIASPAMFSTE
jgi:uncharacterized protein